MLLGNTHRNEFHCQLHMSHEPKDNSAVSRLVIRRYSAGVILYLVSTSAVDGEGSNCIS